MMCLDIPSVRTGHSGTKSDINTGILAPVDSKSWQWGGLPRDRQLEKASSVENLRTIVKPAESQSVLCYYHDW